ncbi:uncharacterized protein LOC119415898 [Nematolebias whitei]|uniref:uncharacterized protein LOC119415898 n=1 Tax=Nematolebias whitei TaxID=451745 RepID=UPI001898D450|nr:uncharacterized protein LOC119415898 [Nematolebias whitei]
MELSRDCKVEVQRILHQRALDVKLDPELQKRCMTDLGKWCSEKTEAGQELECLQDHLEDLVPDCREVVSNMTELESEVLFTFFHSHSDIQIEALLMRACEPVIQSYCHEVADNQIDSGDLMEWRPWRSTPRWSCRQEVGSSPRSLLKLLVQLRKLLLLSSSQTLAAARRWTRMKTVMKGGQQLGPFSGSLPPGRSVREWRVELHLPGLQRHRSEDDSGRDSGCTIPARLQHLPEPSRTSYSEPQQPVSLSPSLAAPQKPVSLTMRRTELLLLLQSPLSLHHAVQSPSSPSNRKHRILAPLHKATGLKLKDQTPRQLQLPSSRPTVRTLKGTTALFVWRRGQQQAITGCLRCAADICSATPASVSGSKLRARLLDVHR